MSYRWGREGSELYSDGHERKDVVDYHQNVFIPQWKLLSFQSLWWDKDKALSVIEAECWWWICWFARAYGPHADCCWVVIWRHDESMFYAHDRRKLCWVHSSEKGGIHPKGEGLSAMIGDLVSPDYGWLKSKTRNADGKFNRAQVVHCAGKGWDGYLTTEDILAQMTTAMDILDADYTDEKHVFALDNATIHTACAPDALSALHMTAGPSVNFNKVKKHDGTVHQPKMRDGTFKDGIRQSFYLLNGVFKGMTTIIQERRHKGHDLPNPTCLCAECSITTTDADGKNHKQGFSCRRDSTTQCCMRKILYCEEDFQQQKSIVEEHCSARGYEVIFFAKFHPETNCVEQCWGYSKQLYRILPESSNEDILIQNMLSVINSVLVESIRRFATRSERFIDAYARGLEGPKAVWAARKYHGHCSLPPQYIVDMIDTSI
ncbi:hypothetical protein CPB85DRAFT_1230986 [Mucidula mucida]|nr:hypothetical protein CPB85DRAFT_1230986 [Mucidula mucida]